MIALSDHRRALRAAQSAAPPPADRELRRAVEAALGRRDLDNPCFASVADSALTYIRIGDLRRLRAALDRSPAPVPAPPALDEEVRELVARARDAVRWLRDHPNRQEVERTVDEWVIAKHLERAVAAVESAR